VGGCAENRICAQITVNSWWIVRTNIAHTAMHCTAVTDCIWHSTVCKQVKLTHFVITNTCTADALTHFLSFLVQRAGRLQALGAGKIVNGSTLLCKLNCFLSVLRGHETWGPAKSRSKSFESFVHSIWQNELDPAAPSCSTPRQPLSLKFSIANCHTEKTM
jgi:hypothetical protein